jgi:uncharacterized protein YceH (UPF0502 family)
MDISLSATEARVLGVLIEKERTTPDYYPLSLSAATTASNQKSNREPVMDLSETQTLEALDGLTAKRLAWEKTPSGSRVTKYAHRLSNTLGLTYDFSKDELGVLCVLMLRGPQTVGEIRARSGRLCEFGSITEAERVLERLGQREDGPYVVKLPRQAGRKDSRYMHLLCGEVEVDAHTAARPTEVEPAGIGERLTALEQAVAALRAELDGLKTKLGV